ncbi:MAG: EthD domain-containing protein [Spongiibacteraceae bacterium]
MIKIIYTWKDNPALTREQCEQHYLNVHTRLAVQNMENSDGVVAYVQSRVKSCIVHDYNNPVGRIAEPDFDRMVELYVASEEVLNAMMDPAALNDTFADHVHFQNVDIPGSLKIYIVDETIPFQRNFRVG